MRTSAYLGVCLSILACVESVAAIEIQFFEHPTFWAEHGSEDPAWSPDGRYLAYRGPIGPDPTRIHGNVLRAASLTGEPLPWFDVLADVHAGSPTWSPDGERIAYAQIDTRPGIWVASPAEAPKVLSNAYNGWMRLAWSPRGDEIAVAGHDTLWLVSAPDGSRRALRVDEVGDSAPAWSPDGRSLAFCSQRSGNPDLWVLSLAADSLRQLTRDAADDCDPTWSPDGRWIAFASNRASHYDLWVVPVAGGEAIQLTDDPHRDESPAWSPRGDRIAFTSSRPAPNPELWGSNIWIASQLPDPLTPVAPHSWAGVKRLYRGASR